jgi:hypothetical protein
MDNVLQPVIQSHKPSRGFQPLISFCASLLRIDQPFAKAAKRYASLAAVIMSFQKMCALWYWTFYATV